MKASALRSLAPTAISALAATWRIRVRGAMPDAPCVVAFWHDEMLPVWKLFAHTGAAALTSQSRDGDLLAALLTRWGYDVVRGSSSRGGSEALAEIVDKARRHVVLITPDGPRGPRHRMKPGAVIAAQRAGVPLYPCRVEAPGIRLEKSWDRFLVPAPLARVEVAIADAIRVPADASREQVDAVMRGVEAIFLRR